MKERAHLRPVGKPELWPPDIDRDLGADPLLPLTHWQLRLVDRTYDQETVGQEDTRRAWTGQEDWIGGHGLGDRRRGQGERAGGQGSWRTGRHITRGTGGQCTGGQEEKRTRQEHRGTGSQDDM